MRQFVISIHRNVTGNLINSKTVFALNIEQARELAKETFKPRPGQFVGATAIQSNQFKSISNKNKNKNG